MVRTGGSGELAVAPGGSHLPSGTTGKAVLTNTRGAGELILEHDFPPGSDMISQIPSQPKSAERSYGIRTVWTIVGIHIRTCYFP